VHRRKFVACVGGAVAGMMLPTRRLFAASDAASARRVTDFLPGGVPGKFAANLASGLGVSFSHSGLKNAECMSRLGAGQEEDALDDGHKVKRIKFEDREQGLRVVLEYTLFPEHHAVVYGGTVENVGFKNIEHLTDLLSYDLRFAPLQKIGDPLVHISKGGPAFDIYPPPAFTLGEVQFFGPQDFTLESGPSGRSSNVELPFFLVEDGDGSSGIFGGLEWSSLWQLKFKRQEVPDMEHYGDWGPDKSFSIQGGIDGVDLTLQPGETFYIPRVLLGFYEGPFDEGRLALRNFLKDWAPPLPKDAPDPHVQATPGGELTTRNATIDKNVRLNAAASAEIGVEYYCLEQWEPWYPYVSENPQTNEMTGWSRGSWVADVERFPDLVALADYVRSLGMKFGLWTDIEVAESGSLVERHHPDWVLHLPGDSRMGLLNFGVPGVQKWAIATYDQMIEQYGLKWIFWDNNIDPGPYWIANEASHRRGWLQHNHIRGVWAVREALLSRHPDVLIENCSSGGRRIDLGMFKRAHFHVLSDQFWYPDAIRYQFSGADFLLPANRIKSIVDTPKSPLDDNVFHANFGGLLSITENIETWSPEEKKRAKQHVDVYKSIRHLLKEDFYPLFPQPQTMKEWDGWQFHNPKTGEGFILAFRVESPQAAANLKLKKLQTGRRYVLQDPYHGTQQVVDGRALMETGLPVKLDLRGTTLWKYSPR
jgi:alpha-galactosidase